MVTGAALLHYISQATASQTVTVAETGPTITIAAVEGNNVINHTEALAGVALSGTVSGLAANSTFNVTVTDNGVVKTYVATVNGAGTAWSATIPATDATALANGTATVAATITDANGNQATASQTVTVAETGPTITIAAVEGNNVINHTEALAGVALSGTVSGLAANSTFNVTVTDNGVVKTYVATVNGAGTAWSATIPATDATALANGTATVAATITDANGNQATASQTVTVAETGPTITIAAVEGNNVINVTQTTSGVTISGTESGANGQTVTVTILNSSGQVVDTLTAVASAGTWTTTLSESQALALQSGVYTIQASVSDANGNTALPASESVTVTRSIEWTATSAGDWSLGSNWNTGTAPTAFDTATVDIAGSYAITVSTADKASSLTVTDAGATISINSNASLTLGGILTLSAGSVKLTGTLSGGTIVSNGGTIVWNGGTLSGVTYDGTMDMSASGSTVYVTNGLTLAGVNGTGSGTINLTGAGGSQLDTQGSETLSNATINIGNSGSND